MSLVSAILFNAPPPVFVGDVRKIIAREMDAKYRPPCEPKQNDGEKAIGPHERGRILRAKIEVLLTKGGRWTTQGIAKKLGASETSTRRHLNNMVDLGFAKSTDPREANRTTRTEFWKS